MAKTLEQKLCTRSLGYRLTRELLVRPAMHLYYRKFDVTGAKKIPDTGPVIFAPNHQNALMDALAVLCTKDRQPVFVARADIFKKPLIISILHFLRILPVYRKRDGGNSSDNNQETFNLILKVLNSRQSVGIMPEGTHNEIKRLRTLQKGIFRLAMQAQENHGTTPNVKIVPVGIEYTNTKKFRSDLMVRYGETIDVSDFYSMYVENPAKAFRHMQDVLTQKMKAGMVNIENDEYYFEIERLRVLYMRRAIEKLGLDINNAEHRLQAQKKIVEALQEHAKINKDDFDALSFAVKDYYDIMNMYNLRDWVVEKQPFYVACLAGRSILALLGIPFWITGMLFNYLPYKLSALSSRKVKDPQFISSVQFVAGIILFPIYHLTVIILMFVFLPCLWGKLIMTALIIPMGLFAFRYYLSIKKLGARFRFWYGMRHKGKKNDLIKAVELRKNIFQMMDNIVITN